MTAGRTHKNHNSNYQRKRWRRVVLLTLLLLLGGAIMNVAVAWGCVLWAPWPHGWVESQGVWPLRTPSGWPKDVRVRRTSNIAITEVDAGPVYEDLMVFSQFVVRAGLPFRSLGLEHGHCLKPLLTGTSLIGVRAVPQILREGWQPPFEPQRQYVWGPYRILPLIPAWPGFAVNTVFYAALLWLPIRGPSVVRRWRRRRQGLCVVCGYDLRGSLATSNVCPECGVESEG